MIIPNDELQLAAKLKHLAQATESVLIFKFRKQLK